MKKSELLILGGPYDAASPLKGQGGVARSIHNIITSKPFNESFNFDLFDDSNSKAKLARPIIFFLDKILRLIKILYSKNYDSALIFCNSINLAFFEKFILVLIVKIRDIRIYVRYGGGIYQNFYSKSYLSPIFSLFFSMQDGIIVQEKTGELFYGKFKNDNILSQANFFKDDDLNPKLKSRTPSQRLRVLLVAGKDYVRKGFHVSIDAVKLVGDKFDFKVISSNRETIKIVRKANLSNYVQSLPSLDYYELKNLLSISDILVLPSSNEGLPNLVLESMANGLVILATEVGSVGDVLIDGQNGFLINSNETDKIANLLNMLNNKRSLVSKIRQNNISKINDRYSESIVVPKLINFLKNN
tara:strand:+ start:788 stop:1861 length:1074 start_codon:yes stop_codon:yes gene_type:complete